MRTLQAFQPAIAVHPSACTGLLCVLAEITHPSGRGHHTQAMDDAWPDTLPTAHWPNGLPGTV